MVWAPRPRTGLMSPDLRTRLLGSIQAGRLVVLCGAGLSMGAPSLLPSAREVANRCFTIAGPIDSALATPLRYDLEGLADHFADSGRLESVFIRAIVPWPELVASPNAGHQAIADLLLTEAAAYGVSTNYDQLIEKSAWDLGGDFVASLDGNEATAARHRPLLKVHGCANRDRERTVWTRRQLTSEPIRTRIQSAQVWLAAHLREKDIVVVGFWSDWNYLNVLLEDCLGTTYPATVVVVDPAPTADLEAKAPGLWRAFHGDGVDFRHEQASGSDLLHQLRVEFSRVYVHRMLATARDAYEARFAASCPPEWLDTSGMAMDDLYAWRRDAEGQRVGRPARGREPRPDSHQAAVFHLTLRHLGAAREGAFYRLNGRLIRVINGAGRWLPEMMTEYSREAPTTPEADTVFCVGADDFGVPAHILRGGTPSTIVRPAPRGTWLDSAAARTMLGV
jgi:hypothetical protein